MYNDILFLDIETVAQQEYYENLNPAAQKLWDAKAKFLIKTDKDTPANIYNRAAIYAEFGKIVCISCGIIKKNITQQKLYIKSFSGHNEKQLLHEFMVMLKKLSPATILCAHNGKEFDFPYIARRLVINQIKLPDAFNIAGKKPWEIQHIDTMELWKFGDFKAYTSLNLLAHVFNIPTPKDDIDGSMVYDVYYKEKNLPRIVTYCQKDVATLTNVFMCINGAPIITEADIVFKD